MQKQALTLTSDITEKKKHKSAFIIFPIASQLYVYITIHIYLNMFVTSKPYQNSVF